MGNDSTVRLSVSELSKTAATLWILRIAHAFVLGARQEHLAIELAAND